MIHHPYKIIVKGSTGGVKGNEVLSSVDTTDMGAIFTSGSPHQKSEVSTVHKMRILIYTKATQ
jgi:hypothetical protein